jgi:hypothetical protein
MAAGVLGPGSQSAARRSAFALAAGVIASFLTFIDPHAATAVIAAIGLGIAAVLRPATRPHFARVAAFCCGAAMLAGSLFQPELKRADATNYFAYLHSLAFDRDLDFANERQHWGYEPGTITATGLRGNSQGIGPAAAWAPFYGAAHAYVRTVNFLGGTRLAIDGYSEPYWRACAAGTLCWAILGALLLARMLAARAQSGVAAGAVLATVGASSVTYYVFVLPTMAHGLAFACAAIAVWSLDRAERTPTLRTWLLLGAATGLLALVRWQAVVFALLPAALAVVQLSRSRARAVWVAGAAAAALVMFLPQAVAWHAIYGHAITMPQGAGFVDWTSPHLRDVLISADHGLFTWTPIAIAGVIGLLLLVREHPLLGIGGLVVCAANAWINGGVQDWAASDAFGARRFDFVMPLIAVGVAELAMRVSRAVRARPMLAPMAIGLLLVCWNLGFVRGFEMRLFPTAAPLAKVAALQARNVQDALDTGLGVVAGKTGRALAYNIGVGEYFYTNVNPSGSIEVGAVESPYLVEGWSKARLREGWPQFRWAHSPRACVRVPLRRPFDMRGVISARAAPGEDTVRVSVTVNGTQVALGALGEAWQSLPFVASRQALVEGDNRVCIVFADAQGDGQPRALAAVSVIQLP